MLAKDLIKILSDNLEAEVVIVSKTPELRGSVTLAESALLVKAKKLDMTFTDWFDGERFSAPVYQIDAEYPNGVVIYIS